MDELVKALKNEVHDLGDVIARLICRIGERDQLIGRLEGNVEAAKAEVALWREGTQYEALQAEAAGLRMGVMFYCQECDDFAACKDCYLDGIKDTTAGQPILNRLKAQEAVIEEIQEFMKVCDPDTVGMMFPDGMVVRLGIVMGDLPAALAALAALDAGSAKNAPTEDGDHNA